MLIQLAQCCFPGLAISNAIKYTEAILSNNIRKLLWFEITKLLIALKERNYRVIYYNFGALSFPVCFVHFTFTEVDTL